MLKIQMMKTLRLRMVPRGGIEPPTQGFSVISFMEQAYEIRLSCSRIFY
jgi:hypothetical protein